MKSLTYSKPIAALSAVLPLGVVFSSVHVAAKTRIPEQPNATAIAPVNFQRDIRPVLSNICSACHGPDEKARKANLRLDIKAGVMGTVVAGHPERSPLYLRMKEHGPRVMPPPDFLHRPTAKQIEQIGQWIKLGAKWEQHWAYAPLIRPAVPVIRNAQTTRVNPQSAFSNPQLVIRNPIDSFIFARLQKEKLQASPSADRRTLLRRLTFDLTGLPPGYDDVQRFVNDRSPDAYEKVVDRLLASERFGERLAVYWLDLVRYADTRGYHGDQNQEISPYRDYVIDAFNKNMPFDLFTREQLAGDLLPNPNQEARVASGYNKLLMTTEEGGSQPKEYMAKYAADRVRNVSAVWMGSTMGCAQCHDHKYDPFTQKDFYSMASFFADVKQTAVGGLDFTPLPTAEESAKIAELAGKIAPLQATLDRQTPELSTAQADWEKANNGVLKKPEAIAAILAIESERRSDKQRQEISAYYRSIAPLLAATRTERAKLQAELDGVNNRVRKTMVTTTVPPAVMRILPRGNWMDESGPEVTPAVPAFLDQLPTNRRANRLDLAEWLTSKKNPLTARVMVNRMWALLFGHGLSRSVEDFGAQGVPPVYPELLDWLASEYADPAQRPNDPSTQRPRPWDTKRLIKLIVMSSAYRLSSVPTAELVKRDPGNDLFGRQGRKRLDAEFVRDNALAVSGLLINRSGGNSVKPYQPAHYWDYLNFPMRTWMADKGEDQYRRGVYSYWCRTYLQPSLLAFDAPTREECCSARVVSNTPQQALVLLNDPTYVEAARVLAERVVHEGGGDAKSRIRALYRLTLQRDPSAHELETLGGIYQRHKSEYDADGASAEELLKVGERPKDSSISAPELAAWTSVTRIVLNLHESITRN